MAFHDRLSFFINKNYKSCLYYSDIIKIENSQLNKYIKGKHSPSLEVLCKFLDSGISIDWLITGAGSMFADNSVGRELKSLYETQYKDSNIKIIKSRIKQWILENFTSFENFTKNNNISYEELLSELEDISFPAPDFMRCINNAGCNIDWVLNGDEKPFTDNPEGFLLQLKKYGIETESSNNWNDFFQRMESLMKKVFRDEKNKTQKEDK